MIIIAGGNSEMCAQPTTDSLLVLGGDGWGLRITRWGFQEDRIWYPPHTRQVTHASPDSRIHTEGAMPPLSVFGAVLPAGPHPTREFCLDSTHPPGPAPWVSILCHDSVSHHDALMQVASVCKLMSRLTSGASCKREYASLCSRQHARNWSGGLYA